MPPTDTIFVLGYLVSLLFNSGMNYWLVKSEPATYSWAMFAKEGKTAWTGVRNFAARLNLRSMKSGDRVFYYHSGEEKAVVGLACVKKEFYPDATADEGDWSCVDLAAEKALTRPVTLAEIKADKILKEMVLAKQSRLSVSPMTREQFERLLKLAETKI
jgi:predicted RNA-binding protein with PUA-like domain